MSSSDFKKHSVIDSRLDIKSDVDFSVFKGGANITAQTYNAISTSTSNIVFNVQMPSVDTVFSKEVLIRTDMIFKLTGAVDGFFQYGATDALKPFPFHQLILNSNLTLNNTSVSVNTRDVLPLILKSMDKADLQRWNSMTPCMQDTYYNYVDGAKYGNNNNVLAGYNNTDNDGRIDPRGAWVVDIAKNADMSGGVPASTDKEVYVRVIVCEPLLISPLSWCAEQEGGISGVQTFGLNLGLNTDATNAWSSALDFATTKTSALLYKVNVAQLLFTFLTPSATMVIPKRCVSTYLDLPRYITPQTQSIAPKASVSIDTSTISLNVIPDALIVYVRNPFGNRNVNSSQANLCIKSITISFNNQAGICANMTSEQLWKASLENGMNQSWQCWNGAYHINPNYTYDPAGKGTYGQYTPAGVNVPSVGCFLYLKFGKDINLNESYLAPSSLGQYQFQCKVGVYNQSADNITPEIVCVFPTSGLFINESGQSNVYSGLLSKADVIETGTQEAYTAGDINRMMGSGWWESLKNHAKKLPPYLKWGRENVLDKLADDHKYKSHAEKASQILKTLGMGHEHHHKGLHHRIK